MYMAGRFRTASRPSRIVISLASYDASEEEFFVLVATPPAEIEVIYRVVIIPVGRYTPNVLGTHTVATSHRIRPARDADFIL
jgi:hypothetical protein